MPRGPSCDAASQGQRIDFAAARPRILTIAFTALWFAGWLLLLGLTALDYVRFGRPNLVAVVLLVAGGPPVGLALLWAASGRRESLIVTPSELRIYRWVGPIRLPRSISASTVVGLRAAIAPRGLLSDFIAVRRFYFAIGAKSSLPRARRRTFSETLPSFGQSINPSCANDASSKPLVTVPVKSVVPETTGVQYAKLVHAGGSDAGPTSENVTVPSARTTPAVANPLVATQVAPCVKEPVKLDPVCWITSVPVQLLKKVRPSPARVNLIVQRET